MDSSTPQQTIDRILKLAYAGRGNAAWMLVLRSTFNSEIASQAHFWWTAALASEICRWSVITKVIYPTPWSLRLRSTNCADYNRLKECGFWSEAASNIFNLGRPKSAIKMLTWAEKLSKNERFKKMVRRQKRLMLSEQTKSRSKGSQGNGPAQ